MSVVNAWNQTHDVPNLFLVDGSRCDRRRALALHRQLGHLHCVVPMEFGSAVVNGANEAIKSANTQKKSE